MIEINPTLTAKQKEALKLLMTNNGVDEVLYGGAAGGGKSYLGCLWLIISAIKYPKTRWLMGRAKLDTLKATTLKTFFEVAAKLGLKEGEHYKYNQMNKLIKFYNDSEIVLKDLFHYPSDPEFDSLGSLEITGAFIDECNQISVKAKTIVGTRIRFKLDEFNLTPKILLTCNPARNWVYNDFYKKQIDGTIEDYKRFIPALNTDNQYITKHYINRLEKADVVTTNILLYGNCVYQDEL
jgi:phage terminase large subunit